MPTPMIVALVIAVLVLLYAGFIFNHLVRLRQNVRESWSDVDTELKRRYDLIPNLVQVVKGYAAHERSTLEAVTEARSMASANLAPTESKAQSEQALGQALQRLVAVAEAYPQLKADESFGKLAAQLSDTETRISQARRFYNANVREMNTAVQSFPSSLVARLGRFAPGSYFQAEDEARGPVAVQLNG